MGKEQELLQAVKSGDLPSTQKLLAKLKTNRNKLLGSTKRLNVNYQDSDGLLACCLDVFLWRAVLEWVPVYRSDGGSSILLSQRRDPSCQKPSDI